MASHKDLFSDNSMFLLVWGFFGMCFWYGEEEYVHLFVFVYVKYTHMHMLAILLIYLHIIAQVLNKMTEFSPNQYYYQKDKCIKHTS